MDQAKTGDDRLAAKCKCGHERGVHADEHDGDYAR